MNQMGVGDTIGALAYHPMNQMGVGGTIGTLAYHPMNQTGVGGTIGTMAYHPMNQTGVGGTKGTIAYHPMNQTGVGGTIGTLAYHPMNQKIPHMYVFSSPKFAYRAKNFNCQKRPFLGKISKNGSSKVNLYHHLLSIFGKKNF